MADSKGIELPHDPDYVVVLSKEEWDEMVSDMTEEDHREVEEWLRSLGPGEP